MPQRRGAFSRKIPIGRYPITPGTYPGRRPCFSFFFTPQGIYRVKLRALNLFLASLNLPPISERYAVLAYGSNACPSQLLQKKLTTIPVLYGRLTGATAVYAHRLTQKGYVPATLARKKGTRSSWINLLTKEQLSAMDRSEGRPESYLLTELKNVCFDVGRSRVTPLYAYVEVRSGVMIHKGQPVNLRSSAQKRAKALLAATSGDDVSGWLEFKEIPHPNPPAKFSQFLRY
jgi:hypothetical protein